MECQFVALVRFIVLYQGFINAVKIREQKNYTLPAKKLLEELILSITIEQDGIKLENSKIKSIVGDVSVSVVFKKC